MRDLFLQKRYSLIVQLPSFISPNCEARTNKGLQQIGYSLVRTRSGSPERTSSVREAINLFGEKMELATKRAREIHVAKMDIGRLCENKKCAEDDKARAESELYMARGWQ
ncbi:uncharacterized protein LOC120251850 [Dioscorea cayenensis subsp. rotundata]|uniref:Uncharacterized protein LOC120251850 n=1 Tax=Dioscorea cayennensis subsp. rotundata TaxID=55577 RepID=A0AB40ANM0_DIOCR|nr:uncharacterized protein LOC120251850 [Dioscorea cayenensis subsp. rotundata]